MSILKLKQTLSAIFSRNSIANSLDATTEYAIDVPRYEVVDGASGILIEEATTNIAPEPSAPTSGEITVTASGDYMLSLYDNDGASGTVEIVHKKVEDSQDDFDLGTLVGVESLASGAIALKMEDDPTFSRATTATKKDFSTVSSGDARFENIVDPIDLDSPLYWDGGTQQGVNTDSSGNLSLDFTPTFTRSSSGWLEDGSVVGVDEPRYEKMAVQTTFDYQEDWDLGTFDSTVVSNSSGEITNLDGSPTFTRSSAAYKMDGTQVDANEPRYEQSKNLLSKNQSDIETDLTGFSNRGSVTKTQDSTTVYQGVYSLKVVTTGSIGQEGLYTSNIDIKPSTQYTFSVYVKGDGVMNLLIDEKDSSGTYITTKAYSFTATSTWTRYTFTVTTGTSTYKVLPMITTGATARVSTFYVDALQLEENSAATTWVPGGESAIMIEEGTTNTLPAANSNFTTGWSNTTDSGRVTWSWNVGGEEKATATTSGNIIVQAYADYYINGSANGGETHTFSVDVDIQGHTSGSISLVILDQQSGAYVGTGTVMSADGSNNGKRSRYSVTRTLRTPLDNSGASLIYRIIFNPGVNAGVTLTLRRAQVEQKSYATSWVLGGTTRSNETLKIPAGTMNNSEGVIIVRAFVGENILNSPLQNHILFDTSNGINSNNRIYILKSAGSTSLSVTTNDSDGTPTTVSWANGYTETGWHTFGFRWNSSETSLWVDGEKRSFAANPNIPSEMNDGYLGVNISGGGAWGYPIDDVNIFHEALTDEEMAEFTLP